jgi:hypothetical protein
VLKFTMEYTSFKGLLTLILYNVVFSLVEHNFHKLNLRILSINLRNFFKNVSNVHNNKCVPFIRYVF